MSLLVELPLAAYRRQRLAHLTVTASYDFAAAGGMAWLSQLAYETVHPERIDQVLAGWRLTGTKRLRSPANKPFSLVDTRALVVQGWGGVIVAFAGTDPLVPANWLTDLDVFRSPDDIHTGFENAVRSIWPELRSAILERDRDRQSLFFTGHSLGGALAVVAAKFASEEGLATVDGVYTFGMPRCGGPRFAGEYARGLGPRTYRFVHGDDIVATLPPANLGFCHVGELLCCEHGERFDPARAPAELRGSEPSFAGTTWQGVRHLVQAVTSAAVSAATQPGALGEAYRFLPPGIGDHIPSRYLHALGFDL